MVGTDSMAHTRVSTPADTWGGGGAWRARSKPSAEVADGLRGAVSRQPRAPAFLHKLVRTA